VTVADRRWKLPPTPPTAHEVSSSLRLVVYVARRNEPSYKASYENGYLHPRGNGAGRPTKGSHSDPSFDALAGFSTTEVRKALSSAAKHANDALNALLAMQDDLARAGGVTSEEIRARR
jgi:hypothetical protein